jgi:SPP1 gp7 family putative phage head morphogenesis protein
MLAARAFQAKAQARRPWGKLQVERVEDKLADRFERHALSMAKRFRARIRRAYEPKAQFDEFGGDVTTEDEYAELEEQIYAALQVSIGLAQNRGKMEGHYKTAAVQGRLDRGVESQLGYLSDAETAMREDMALTVQSVIEERGPDINLMMVKLEQRFPLTVARCRTIAVTETEKVYGNAYADILEENGWDYCRWRASPDEKVCDECQELDLQVMTLAEWRSLFPKHPNCRCWNEGYKGEWTGY